MKNAWTVLCLCLMGALSSVGCTSGPQPYNVEISIHTASGDFRENFPSLDVDLIPVSAGEAPEWEHAVSNYYDGESSESRHRDLWIEDKRMATISFRPDQRTPPGLKYDDPLWNSRIAAGATHLIVMTNLEIVREGDSNRRRTKLPLDYDCWKTDTIQIRITDIGIDVTTRPLPCEEE